MNDLLEHITEINFKRKKVHLSPDLRPVFKVSQIVIVLKVACYNNAASLLKIQFFNWIFKTEDHYAELEDFSKDKYPIIRFDPAVNRAIVYAISEQILVVDKSSGKIKLADKGEKFANEILNDEFALLSEKELLGKVKKKVTESYLDKVFKERYRFDE